LEGCAAQITGGTVADYRVKLTFSGDTTGLTGVSYLSHIDSISQNWVVNPLGLGMLLFYDVPIHKKQLTDTTPLYTEGGAFDIAPTVVSDFLNIHFLSNEKTKKRIDVVNAFGQIVLTKQIEANTENTTLDVEDMPKGIYFVVLNMQSHSAVFKKTRKFVRI
jgi:hypothetical protein